ncbi:MAG: transglycosylase domain-containing protein [Chloroflexota bacterium]|nr:transglycosylase domain-containing protein [Chloroflexota bacterium]
MRSARQPRRLPPHLLPGITGRDSKKGGGWVRWAIATTFLLLIGIGGILITSAISTAAAVGGTVVAYREVNETLPNTGARFATTYQTTRFLDRNGELLQEVADQDFGWRTYIEIDQVAQVMIDATIAAEDATFWSHFGVEPTAIVRALTIQLGGTGTSGFSTITQQLVRSIHDDQISASDISYSRKFREMLAAVAVEQEYSKHDILAMYMNQIFYGNRSYGIEAAAQTYFHKHASELNLSEASLLAGIPQQPTRFNPSINPDDAKERQVYVLDQMVKLGYITRAEADAAYLEFPMIYPERDGNGAVLDHPHFVQYAKEYLAETYPEQDFLKSGLNIYTTIDTAVQDRAEEIVARNMEQLQFYEAFNASMVVMVPYTGEILAMVGSANYSNPEIEGQVNIATSQQQPGSAIKPIVYAAAFEQGWHPGTVVLDAPFRIETPGRIDPITQQEEPYYEPQNYLRTFNGALPVREALANSLNIPAIKAVQYAGGPSAIIDIGRRMGLKHGMSQEPSEYGLAIGLGAADIWPLELTNAYATLANNGKYVPASPILKIEDNAGNILWELDRETTLERAEQALRAEHAYQVTSILTDNNARARIFTTSNLFGQTQQQLGRPTAAKSGTSNEWRDTWTVGYTTDLAIGVWVGNTRNEPLRELDGIQSAGPIWNQMMLDMHDRPEFAQLLTGPNGQPVADQFPVPPGIYQGVVCNLTGGRPTDDWNNKIEVLVQGGGPAQRCDQLSPWARADLARTLENIRQRGGNLTSGAQGTINEYARGVRVGGSGGPEFPMPRPPAAPEE